MDDALALQQDKAVEQLPRKSSYELQREALEGVFLDKLVQVYAETRRDDAQVRAEVERGRDG